jgi:hypothetical protein
LELIGAFNRIYLGQIATFYQKLGAKSHLFTQWTIILKTYIQKKKKKKTIYIVPEKSIVEILEPDLGYLMVIFSIYLLFFSIYKKLKCIFFQIFFQKFPKN